MNPPDRRSVGELLLDTELTAREILNNGGNLDAAAMLRTWPEVVQGAGELWRALPDQRVPDPGTGQVGPRGDPTMSRLEDMTIALHRSTHGHRWPGDGPADERLLQMAENLTRAAAFVEGNTAPGMPQRREVQADLTAAKARLMHALYIGSHGVSVALGDHTRDLEATYAARKTLPHGQSLQVARSAHSRLAAFEQQAGAYVARTYPQAPHGEHREPANLGRLAQALAEWDIQAHRALNADPRAANLMMAARTQAFVVGMGHVLLDAAARNGHLDSQQYRQRLSPALERAQSRWNATAELWTTLTPPSQGRPDPAITRAGAEVRATLLDLVHDRTALASPETIAVRIDLDVAIHDIQQALSSTVELGHLVNDVVEDPHLAVAARTVNTMAVQITRAENAAGIDDSPISAWVEPRDLATNRPTGLPDPVRDACRSNIGQTFTASRDAMGAAAMLDHTPQPAQVGEGPMLVPGRWHQDRETPSMPVDAPAAPCER